MNHFDEILEEMRRHNMPLPQEKTIVKVANSREVLVKALTYFLNLEGKQLEWLPEYEEVANWLSNSEGSGLFLYGNCGRGKTLLVRYVLPAILLKYCGKVVNVYDIQQMNGQIDEVMQRHVISLDDVGTEEVVNSYGNKRQAFAEIMDAVEKQSKLILISTNLQQSGLRLQYGDRILDRVLATTKRIAFNGSSLRV